jgi:hypothetical protein
MRARITYVAYSLLVIGAVVAAAGAPFMKG